MNSSNTLSATYGTGRTGNADNEMTDFGGASLTYDNAGNLLTGPGLPNDEQTAYGGATSTTYVYDAWNRLVMVKNADGDVVKMYTYDGLGRKISESDGTTTTDHYYKTSSQDIEQDVGGSAVATEVFSPVYTNAIILRDRDTDGNGSLDERLYFTSDANEDVTGVISMAGAVLQREMYTSYGTLETLNGSFAGTSDAYKLTRLWQGMELDNSTGMYGTANRWYSPDLMRWLTADPISYGDGMNYYRAMADNPISLVDPSGLAPGDKTYGLPSDFWDWYHRQRKGDGDCDLSKDDANEEYREWLSQGRPDGEGHRRDKNEPNDTAKKSLAVVVGVGALWGLWEGIKWTAAVTAAPETLGASLLGAAAIP